MSVCDLNSGLGQLSHAFSKLRDRLNEVKSHWDDEALLQFEQQHLSEIPGRLQLVLAATQRLREVLIEAERDCEDRIHHDG